jgi:hypothetical protein
MFNQILYLEEYTSLINFGHEFINLTLSGLNEKIRFLTKILNNRITNINFFHTPNFEFRFDYSKLLQSTIINNPIRIVIKLH